MNWFKRHLNWTMVLGYLGAFVGAAIAGFILGSVMVSADPYVVVGFIVALAILIPIWGWALRKKNRSLWWLPLGLFVPFGFIVLLCLENRSQNLRESGISLDA